MKLLPFGRSLKVILSLQEVSRGFSEGPPLPTSAVYKLRCISPLPPLLPGSVLRLSCPGRKPSWVGCLKKKRKTLNRRKMPLLVLNAAGCWGGRVSSPANSSHYLPFSGVNPICISRGPHQPFCVLCLDLSGEYTLSSPPPDGVVGPGIWQHSNFLQRNQLSQPLQTLPFYIPKD